MNPSAPVVAAISLSLTLGCLSAQCGLQATPGFAHLGPSSQPDTVCYWDVDGAGPAPMRVFVGGAFEFVEAIPCAGAALYDPDTQSWTALPAGPFDRVRAAVVDAGNALLVAGTLGQGAQARHRVARWNGVAWTVLGGDFDAEPLVLATLSGGDPVVGGRFTTCAGLPASGVARFDGSQWTSLGGGVTGGAPTNVQALHRTASGDLLAGGAFTMAGASAAQNIARWNGASWQVLGAGIAQEVASITAFSSGEVFATGPTLPAVRQWNGSAWSDVPDLQASFQFPAGPWIGALGIATGYNGEALLVVGDFSAFGQEGGAALWELNFGWSVIYLPMVWAPAQTPTRLALAVDPRPVQNPPSRFALAGPFEAASGTPCNGVAVMNSWQVDPTGGGIDGPVLASASLPNGDLLIGGSFRRVERSHLSALARGDGEVWTSTSSGGGPVLTGTSSLPEVNAIEPTADGSLLLAGSFALGANGDVVRYDGTNWSGFGATPFLGGAYCVLERSDGTVFAGGNGMFRSDATGWTLITTQQTGLFGQFFTLAELPGGDVVAGGALQTIPGGARPGLMRWDGQSWQPLGAGLPAVLAGSDHFVNDCVVRDDGALFVVGGTSTQAFVARFDGVAWQALPAPPTGELHTVALLPDGDVVVGGRFDAIGGVSARSLARWDGAAWSAFAGGVGDIDGAPGEVLDLRFTRHGELHIGGRFAEHDGLVAVNFTRVQSTCPAATQTFGPTCGGSGGPNVLRSERAAWLGGTMQSIAEGLPAGGLALEVLGLSPTVQPLPLSSCTLWVAPDLPRLALPVAGRVELTLPIPAAMSLLGTVLYQQVVGVELTGGSITGLSAGNRLQQTIGVF